MVIKNKQIKEKFERIVQFTPAFDKRSSEPGKNYGIGAVRIRFILKGKNGSVQVLIGTDWYLPKTIKEYREEGNKNLPAPIILRKDEDFLNCGDVGFHSKKRPEYMETNQKSDCDILGKCYYDGSSCRGDSDKVDMILLEKGSDGIWEYLENYYKEVFN